MTGGELAQFIYADLIQKPIPSPDHVVSLGQLYVILAVVIGFTAAMGLTAIGIKWGVLRFGNKETPTNNHNGLGRMQTPIQICSLCAEHTAEKERSIRNAQEIDALWREYKDLRDSLTRKVDDGFNLLNRSLQKLLVVMAAQPGIQKEKLHGVLGED